MVSVILELQSYVTAEPQLYFRMFTDKAFRRQLLSQTERPLQHKAMLYFGAAHPRIERIRFDSIPEDRVIVDPQTVGRDTIALWFNMPSSALPDTIKGEITYFKHDTVNVLQSVTEPLKLAWRFIETKEQEKEREKLERDRRKAGGVKVGAKWFHSDEGSRIQQMGLVMMGASIPANLQWKTMDGSFVQMTPALAQDIFAAATAHDVAVFAAAETHRVAMEASADPASYDYSGGWPAIFGE